MENGSKHGYIHIYTGEGKGKTTAAVGLAVRFAGCGGRVLFSQMLKDGSSGELAVLEQLENVETVCCRECFGFSFSMDEETRKRAKKTYARYLAEVLERAGSGRYGLLVLDEVLAAYNLGFADREALLAFLRSRPEDLEVVLTGRDPAPELLSLADYVSVIKKEKHPFDQGIRARKGIEY